MPYRCVHCSKLYNDGSAEILTGCSECGRKFFFYIRKEQLKKIAEENFLELKPFEKEQVEKDVRDITGLYNEEDPIFLDFESIRVIKPGKYLVDLTNLFSIKKPRVYKLEDGKYIIDLTNIKAS